MTGKLGDRSGRICRKMGSVWGVTNTRKTRMFEIGGNFVLRAAKSVGTTGLRGLLYFNEFA
jgi:hypothetical protein